LGENQPPRRFLSRVAIDKTQNRNLDPKVRIVRDRHEHHGKETQTLRAAEREQQSRQKPETQPRPSVTVIQMKLMEATCTIGHRMVKQFQSMMEL
jgi:hypothetical protein